jgi:hypothetical protein
MDKRSRLEALKQDLEEAYDDLVSAVLAFEGDVPDTVPAEWTQGGIQ